MSGFIPNFLRKGCYVLMNGSLVKVKDYFFTSGYSNAHNTDLLVLEFKGKDPVVWGDPKKRIEPIRKGKRPDFLEVGKSVCVKNDPVHGNRQKIIDLYYVPQTRETAKHPDRRDLVIVTDGHAPRAWKKGLFFPAP